MPGYPGRRRPKTDAEWRARDRASLRIMCVAGVVLALTGLLLIGVLVAVQRSYIP